jgi:hypothetical protein
MIKTRRDLAQTQVEPGVEPDNMRNGLGRKSVPRRWFRQIVVRGRPKDLRHGVSGPGDDETTAPPWLALGPIRSGLARQAGADH